MAVKMFAPNYHDIPLFKGLGREEINEVLHKFHGLIKHFPKSDYIIWQVTASKIYALSWKEPFR